MHLLRGDLDWIVMKCLEKDRTRRYETANGLAADLQRHLEQRTGRGPPAQRGVSVSEGRAAEQAGVRRRWHRRVGARARSGGARVCPGPGTRAQGKEASSWQH